jgi:hypothetical protein
VKLLLNLQKLWWEINERSFLTAVASIKHLMNFTFQDFVLCWFILPKGVTLIDNWEICYLPYTAKTVLCIEVTSESTRLTYIILQRLRRCFLRGPTWHCTKRVWQCSVTPLPHTAFYYWACPQILRTAAYWRIPRAKSYRLTHTFSLT